MKGRVRNQHVNLLLKHPRPVLNHLPAREELKYPPLSFSGTKHTIATSYALASASHPEYAPISLEQEVDENFCSSVWP